MIKKQSYQTITIVTILLAVISLLLATYYEKNDNSNNKFAFNDLPDILKRDTLHVGTLYGSTTYFIYKGEAMGWQYDLSESLANQLNVELKIHTANSIDSLIHLLKESHIDIIAYYLPKKINQSANIIQCGPKLITHQVLVQRNRGKHTLKNVSDLIGKTVYINSGDFETRLKNLNSELGGGINIHIIPTDSLSTEEMIGQVSHRKMDFTIAKDQLAKVNQTYYSNINIDLNVGFDQQCQWVISKNAIQLKEAINAWNTLSKKTPHYLSNQKKYFERSKLKITAPLEDLENGRISVYDDLFKKYADSINWDWRLLASLAYTETRFIPTVESWAGAKGLMQLMPATARAMNIPKGKETDPQESIAAACRYIKIMQRNVRKKAATPEDQIKFVLASYHAGLGHLYDAIALTRKYNGNPKIWDGNVEKYILLKAKKKYYNDPVVKYGYFRGSETYQYVKNITERFAIYKQKVHK